MLYSQSDTHPRRRFGLRRMTYPDKGSKKPRNFLYFILIFFNYRMEYKIGTDARCAVIGYGSWATAIVGLLAANGRRVGWYVRNPEVLESL